MRTIAISFSLKGQDFKQIYTVLSDITQRLGPCVLIHGNLPRKEVIRRGLSTEMVDRLDELFPIQLNMWNEKVLRDEMADFAKSLNADVYVIGNIKGGVQTEVDIYHSKGLKINHLELIN